MIALAVDDVDGHSTTSYLQRAPMDKDLPTFFVVIAEIMFFDLKSTFPLGLKLKHQWFNLLVFLHLPRRKL